MHYHQTLDFLYSQLPMFHRVGAAAYKADLKNTITICNLLGNPQQQFKTIHVAGTNGKGSVSHMLASVLQQAGYKTGLYTSPHLKDFRERIKVNGKMILKKDVCLFVENNMENFKKIKPSFFEMTVGLAFQHFKNESVDVAVIETGLGGRLDSTNIIHPILSVITNIGFDHMNLLGDTLEKIATEKAGIIKTKTPVIFGETQKSIKPIFIDKAKQLNSNIFFADENYLVKKVTNNNSELSGQLFNVYLNKKLIFKKIHLPLLGNYQRKNLTTVFNSIDVLNTIGVKTNEKNVRKGLTNTVKNTRLMGRWQVLKMKPITICDVGHNEDGIREVAKQLNSYSFKKLHFVLGVVSDKDVSGILKHLPKSATYYFCKATIPRGLNAEMLKAKANQFGLKGTAFQSVKEAYEKAIQHASDNDMIFIGGSFFTVAEVL